MNAKGVEHIFRDAILQLKRHYGEEASVVEVVEFHAGAKNSMSESDDAVLAYCNHTHCLKYAELWSAKIAINAKLYLQCCASWKMSDKDVCINLLNLACHEMAHHLATHRAFAKIRSKKYPNNKARWAKLEEYIEADAVACHHQEWQNIMEEMGACVDDGHFQPTHQIPRIFR